MRYLVGKPRKGRVAYYWQPTSKLLSDWRQRRGSVGAARGGKARQPENDAGGSENRPAAGRRDVRHFHTPRFDAAGTCCDLN